MKSIKPAQNQLKIGFTDKSSSPINKDLPSNNLSQGRIVSFDPRQDIYKKILSRKME